MCPNKKVVDHRIMFLPLQKIEEIKKKEREKFQILLLLANWMPCSDCSDNLNKRGNGLEPAFF